MKFLDAFLSRLPLWRRIRGGHWEEWWVDSPVNGDVWHRVPECSLASHTKIMRARPTPLCRGTPHCEDYP